MRLPLGTRFAAPLLLSLLAVACGSSTTNTVYQCPPGDGGTVTADGGDGAAAGPLGFNPSNIDLSGLDLTKVDDVIVTGANCGIVDTETAFISCVDSSKYQFKIITLPNSQRMSIYVMKSLRVEASALMKTTNHIAVAIVTLKDMTFLGSMLVDPGTAGGAFNTQADAQGIGPGGGATGASPNAGGGGSFCGIGGQGASETGAALRPKSSAYGTANLVPLVAGSAGGSGTILEGAGGGAIQLVAGGAFTMEAGSFINAPGRGGWFGGAATGQEAGGGGSGGAILIEANTATIKGTLAANGGGGGQGATGDAGETGQASAVAAQGGKKGQPATSPGGEGSAADNPDGANGNVSASATAGGAGGGAGRIRINTKSGSADVTSGTVSPSKNTTCFTQGTVQ